MRFKADAGGQRLTIEVRPAGAGWRVTVDGREKYVSLARTGTRWSMLVDDGLDRDASGMAARSFDVAIEPGGRGGHRVYLDGRVVSVELVDARRRALRAGPTGANGGHWSVSSPMAGRVVKVLVQAGQRVASGQGLVVVESMKMENELRAPGTGRLLAVRVQEGQPVEANVPLVMIGPDEDA